MVFVITGGPGFGKTTVLNLLAEKGFLVGSEAARDLLFSNRDQLSSSKLPPNFERIVANERISFLQSTDQQRIAFADRGLPDQVAYSWYKEKTPSTFIQESANRYRYAPIVFVAPPWKEIFVGDEIRQESFEQACEIHGFIIRAYTEYGYQIVELPLSAPDKRVGFILETLGI